MLDRDSRGDWVRFSGVLAIVAVFGILWLVSFAFQAAYGRDVSGGAFAQYTDEQREWLKNRQVPLHPGTRCCDELDGTKATEESNAPYTVSFEACYTDYVENSAGSRSCVSVNSMVVPSDAVIREPNKIGLPVVWYRFDGGKVTIKCYLPGVGI